MGGDIHMLRGSAIFLQPDKFPYTPGMDVCGIIEEVHPSVKDFKVGQTVSATGGMSPIGGMAEFMKVDIANTVLKPKNVPIVQAIACWSAVTSYNACKDYVKEGFRVLILGGSGGVGSSTIPLAKKVFKASYVATTSTQAAMCKELGADAVINYKEKNWWEIDEYQNEKFDVIIDTVGGGYLNRASNVLKSRKHGGRFVAVALDEPDGIPKAETWWKAINFFCSLPLRPMYMFCCGRYSNNPGYSILMPKDETNACRSVLDLINEGKLAIKLDPRSDPPLPFTQDDVQEAVRIVGSRHAHGKVVVGMKQRQEETKKSQ